jgi:superfamily II RNA helicase
MYDQPKPHCWLPPPPTNTLQLASAARVLGDEGLRRKIEDSAALVRRDIMFSASLYI